MNIWYKIYIFIILYQKNNIRILRYLGKDKMPEKF